MLSYSDGNRSSTDRTSAGAGRGVAFRRAQLNGELATTTLVTVEGSEAAEEQQLDMPARPYSLSVDDEGAWVVLPDEQAVVRVTDDGGTSDEPISYAD